MKRNNFTLLELVIGICVIAVLTGMLMVTSAQVRAKADITHCAANMHQLGRYYTTYAAHNEWKYPALAWVANTDASHQQLVSSTLPASGTPGTDDFIQGGAYMPRSIASINLCPSDENPEKRDYLDENGHIQTGIPSSYGYNLTVMIEGWGLDQIDNPSNTIVSYDASGVGNAGQEEGETEIVDGEAGSGPGNNNGHGNNEDGVDSSNPNQGNGNGKDDTSYDEDGNLIDDENKDGNGNGGTLPTEDYDIVLSDSRDWQSSVYDNVSKRHLNDANYLFFDGAVRYGEEITDAKLSPGELFPGEDNYDDYDGGDTGTDIPTEEPSIEEPAEEPTEESPGNGNGNKKK